MRSPHFRNASTSDTTNAEDRLLRRGGLEIREEGLPVGLQDFEEDGPLGAMTLVRLVTVMPRPLASAPRRGTGSDRSGSEHRT